jgi:integrase
VTSTRLLPVRADNGKEQTMTQTEVNAAFTDKIRRGVFRDRRTLRAHLLPMSSGPGLARGPAGRREGRAMIVRCGRPNDAAMATKLELMRVDVRFSHADGRRERFRLAARGTTRSGADEANIKEKRLVPTVAEFAGTFIEKYARANNKPSEVATKASVLRLYVMPAWREKRLDEIGSLEIDALKVALLGSGLRPKTVVNALFVISRMLGYAVELGHLERVPAIRFPKCQVPPFDFLSFDEATILLGAAKTEEPDWYAPVFVTLRTGLRRGELFELRWADVRLHNAVPHLRVARSVVRGEVGTTKNARERVVYLTPATAALLDSRRGADDALVFPGAGGRHVPQQASDTNLRRLCRKAGLRPIGWHVMRHTYASHLAMRGVSLKVIQEQLCHSTLQMTMRYAHLSPDSLGSAVAKLDD